MGAWAAGLEPGDPAGKRRSYTESAALASLLAQVEPLSAQVRAMLRSRRLQPGLIASKQPERRRQPRLRLMSRLRGYDQNFHALQDVGERVRRRLRFLDLSRQPGPAEGQFQQGDARLLVVRLHRIRNAVVRVLAIATRPAGRAKF